MSASASPLSKRLEAIASKHAALTNTSVDLAAATSAAVASAPTTRRAVWGSVTKMLTAAAVLQHVARGDLGLDSCVAELVDPQLAALKLPPMRTLFGPDAQAITLSELLGMRSGVPDYDTAVPYPRPPTDAFRAEVYAHPAREYPPAALLNQTWVRTGALDFQPGSKQRYSSTNYVLAGLALAQLSGAASWDEYEQASVLDALPPAARAAYRSLAFAAHGTPALAGAFAGYDRTSYNGHNASARPGIDVTGVAGVYGGWTASDLTASAADVARFAYNLFGSAPPRVLPPELVGAMIPKGPFYGLGCFNLTNFGLSGHASGPYTAAYGHLGATYGYDSLVAYWPGLDAALAVGTGVETDYQELPRAVLCEAFAAVEAHISGKAEAKCAYRASGYWGGKCVCEGPKGESDVEMVVRGTTDARRRFGNRGRAS